MNNLHTLVKKNSLNTYQNIFNIVNICAALDLGFFFIALVLLIPLNVDIVLLLSFPC